MKDCIGPIRMCVCAITVMCLVVAQPAAVDRAVPFGVGEALTYDVSWSNTLTAGTATLAIKERRNMGSGRTAYYLVAEAQPSSLLERLYHVYYKAESLLDTETLRPSHATMYSDERGRIRCRATTFLPGDVATYEVRTASVARSDVKVLPQSQDPLSALYVLRTIALKPGESMTVPFVNNGKNYRVRARVVARETIDTGMGKLPAWRLTPVIEDEQGRPATARNLTLWLSDDAKRLPLRVAVDLPVGSFGPTLSASRSAPPVRR